MKTFTARISQMDQLKVSRNGGEQAYTRVYFQVKDQDKSTPEKKVYFWAKTDIVPGFRNYNRWKDLMIKGNVLKNLQMKTKDTIDADSFPVLVGHRQDEPVMVALQKSLWKK